MCYCFTVPVVHLSYPFHVEFCSLSHVVCFHSPDLCGLLLFTCICFHLLPVVISPLLFRQLCSLSSSPVFGSTSHCPVTQFPCPSIPLPSGVCSFSSTPPSHDIILLSTVTIHHPSRSIPIIKSSSVRTPVLLSWTSVLSSRTVVPVSWTNSPFDAAQSLTIVYITKMNIYIFINVQSTCKVITTVSDYETEQYVEHKSAIVGPVSPFYNSMLHSYK